MEGSGIIFKKESELSWPQNEGKKGGREGGGFTGNLVGEELKALQFLVFQDL